MLALNADEILHWNDLNATQWRAFFAAHPEALALACDVYNGQTVADLLQHIAGAELRYAERLAGVPVTDYADLPKDSAEELFGIHDRAFALLRELLADSSYDWSVEIDLATRSAGMLIASRKTVFFHEVLHSMRHYAQLAMLLRQANLKTPWPHDFLFTGAKRKSE